MSKSNINIASMSDIHGFLLPKDILMPSDILTISGDIFPLSIQSDIDACEHWLIDGFSAWADDIPYKHIIMIAGNHDFYFAEKHKLPDNASSKLIYLEDSSCECEGISFYGCPWCIGPYKWAFCPNKNIATVENHYLDIPKCDILLTHQPPKVGDIGVSLDNYPARDYSSIQLTDAIYNKDIVAVFCGHVHSGNHDEMIYETRGCDTKFYNVSILNEKYRWSFPPRYTVFNINKRSIKNR